MESLSALRRFAWLLLAIAALTSCPYNLSLKDELEFASSIVPARSWDELRGRINETPAGGSSIIGVVGGFGAKDASVSAPSPIITIENKTITLVSAGGETIILRADINEFFLVKNGGSLILGDSRSGGTLVLDGNKDSITTASPIVNIAGGGNCIMNSGAVLRNNSAAALQVSVVSGAASFTMNGGAISGNSGADPGGGVSITGGGSTTFTMNGGAISGNEATLGDGGGVYISVSGGNTVFTMTGGTIAGNNTNSAGGGLCVTNGEFIMSGGTISGNNALKISGSPGGGVCIANSTFTMSGGTIAGNTATSYGGGVYCDGGDFTMNGGNINGNTASASGGGVYLDSSSVFVMDDGSINGNTATISGGGVEVKNSQLKMTGGTISNNNSSYGGGVNTRSGGSSSCSFSMEGGTIYGNAAKYSTVYGSGGQGGGVCVVNNNSQFTKIAGTIFGKNEGENSNITEPPTANSGQAVYVDSSPPKYRDTTAGPGVALNSANNINWND